MKEAGGRRSPVVVPRTIGACCALEVTQSCTEDHGVARRYRSLWTSVSRFGGEAEDHRVP